MASFTKTVRRVTYTPNDSSDLVIGVVSSLTPLKIKIGDVELSNTFFILSPNCTSLKIGTSLYMLKCNNGQLYYALQKVGD